MKFSIDLAEVAIAFGVNVKLLRELRREHLTEGVDYAFEGNRCLFTKDALEKLRMVVVPEKRDAAPSVPQDASENLPAPLTLPDPEKGGASQAAAEPRRVRVVSSARWVGASGRRQHFPNPTVVKCEFIDSPGETCFVRVSSSTHYSPQLRTGEPMTFLARQVGGRWESVGRAPRFPGKW